jgi:glycosyltransferase involved in cell wall biosynthesis
MDYKLSVIIPTFNAETYLIDAVNSVKNQTLGFENIELILVDDNSTDNTKNILSDLSSKYPNVISILSKGNSGTASAPRNHGIEKASADYIMFLDNDDEYYPEMCETMYEAVTFNNADTVTCRYDIVKNNIINKPKSFLDTYPNFIKLNNIDEFPDLMTLGFPTMIWTKIFKKNIILENNIEFPVGHLYEDVYFSTKAYLYAKKNVILNNFYGYKYNVRVTGDSKSTSQVFTKNLVEKQLNGFLDVMKLIGNNKKYHFLWNEIIVDMSKIYLYSSLNKGYQEYFLETMKPYYKKYKLNSKLHTAGLPFNILINIFIKIFSYSDFLAILISNTYSYFKK